MLNAAEWKVLRALERAERQRILSASNRAVAVQPVAPAAEPFEASTVSMLLARMLAEFKATQARQPWKRPCFICESLYMCEHREPELVEIWESGARE